MIGFSELWTAQADGCCGRLTTTTTLRVRCSVSRCLRYRTCSVLSTLFLGDIMRDSFVELGIGVIGQAVRDWRLESKACNHRISKNGRIKEITLFLRSELASLILNAIDMDANVLLENLKKESARKRLETKTERMEKRG